MTPHFTPVLTAGVVIAETADAGDLLELTLRAEADGGVEDSGEADDQREEGLRVQGGAAVGEEGGLAGGVRGAVQRRPGEVAEVEGDDGGLQQPGAGLALLHLRDDADDAQGDADRQVGADEELVQAAAAGGVSGSSSGGGGVGFCFGFFGFLAGAGAVVDVEEDEAGEGEAEGEESARRILSVASAAALRSLLRRGEKEETVFLKTGFRRRGVFLRTMRGRFFRFFAWAVEAVAVEAVAVEAAASSSDTRGSAS